MYNGVKPDFHLTFNNKINYCDADLYFKKNEKIFVSPLF